MRRAGLRSYPDSSFPPSCSQILLTFRRHRSSGLPFLCENGFRNGKRTTSFSSSNLFSPKSAAFSSKSASGDTGSTAKQKGLPSQLLDLLNKAADKHSARYPGANRSQTPKSATETPQRQSLSQMLKDVSASKEGSAQAVSQNSSSIASKNKNSIDSVISKLTSSLPRDNKVLGNGELKNSPSLPMLQDIEDNRKIFNQKRNENSLRNSKQFADVSSEHLNADDPKMARENLRKEFPDLVALMESQGMNLDVKLDQDRKNDLESFYNDVFLPAKASVSESKSEKPNLSMNKVNRVVSEKTKDNIDAILKLEELMIELNVPDKDYETITSLLSRYKITYGGARVKGKKLKLHDMLNYSQFAKLLSISMNDLNLILNPFHLHYESSTKVPIALQELIAFSFDYQYTIVTTLKKFNSQSKSDESGDPRPPVITVMGHVNHGKTSLLDTFRAKNARHAPTEAGSITQAIGTFSTKFYSGDDVTFFDTPGHSLFNKMRENVAKVTDILVVIIAVDEGIKQQTEEVIKLGMSFEIPMLIALNKCDKHVDSREIEKIKMELSNMGVHLEDQGGDVQVVQLSAKTEKGLTDFQDAVLLLSEMLQPKARRDVPAEVMIIENRLDRMHGQLLFGLVQRGTLSKGNYVVVDKHHGQIVSLLDFQGKKINSATPGMPVFIKAFSSLPEPGKVLHVVSNAREAEKYVTDFATAKVDETSVEPSESSDSTIFNNQKPVLNLMVKADLAGSIQSIEDYVSRMPKDFVSARVLSSGIGNISEMDVEIAAESKSLIVGFNVGPHTNAKSAIKRYEGKVKVITSRIVYDLLSKINQEYLDLMDERFEYIFSGKARMVKKFEYNVAKRQYITIAGCHVFQGRVEASGGTLVKVFRAGECIAEDSLKSLKFHRDNVELIEEGSDCGIALANFGDFEPDDILECYSKKILPKTEEWLLGYIEKNRERTIREEFPEIS